MRINEEDFSSEKQSISHNPYHGIQGEQRKITAENALIENIFSHSRQQYVSISYSVSNRNRPSMVRLVTLVVGSNTRMRDQFGNRIGFRDLRVGMIVNAVFSANMSRSNPPQAQAFSIQIVKESKSSLIEEGRVVEVREDRDFGFIITGRPGNPNRQMKYIIGRDTKLRDRRGNRITLRSIRPGQIVRIEREPFQTMSIPPQTTAISVQIISGNR